MEFTASYIVAGKVVNISGVNYHQGDKVTAATFNQIAQNTSTVPTWQAFHSTTSRSLTS